MNLRERAVAPRFKLTPLAWDSGHFQFPVARLSGGDLDDAELVDAIREASRQGIRLVYWATEARREVPEPLLQAYGGVLADHKATFQIDDLLALSRCEAGGSPAFVVTAAPRGDASPELLTLAVAAGAYSRFRTDPSFPEDRFRSLYETWMHRCTRGELADVVLVGAPSGGEDRGVGIVTVSVSGGLGQIGLIAVCEAVRGRGVGSLLLRAAHAWMVEHGATRATVVTQLANKPACRLYEHAGYRIDSVVDCYHFWPAAALTSPPLAPHANPPPP
jgi:dTDP-4-amino-4,6-dideoxy-D-galactose acyltransferase